jgi:hypothetical protein
MYIGDIFIPYVNELSTQRPSKNVKVTEQLRYDPTLNKETLSSRDFQCGGVICQIGNSAPDDLSENVEAVIERDGAYNFISYTDTNGFLVCESGDIAKTAETELARNYSFSGKYFPLTKYQRNYQINLEYSDNDYNINFPPMIALPTSSYNVAINTAWDSIVIEPIGYIYGNDGHMPVYRPFGVYDEQNYDSTVSTGDVEYIESAHGSQVYELDAISEVVTWDVDIGKSVPKCVYKLILRLKDGNVADDIELTILDSESDLVYSETISTGSSDWILYETSDFQLNSDETYTINITKGTEDVNTILIDYCFLIPDTVTRLGFDYDEEREIGEVKVFDSKRFENSSDYQQIYDLNHEFDGTSKIVIENSLFSWEIDISKFWEETGYITHKTTGYSGQLYPIAFGNNDIVYKFIQIKPDIVEIEFYLGGGESDYSADDCKEIANVKITLSEFKFDLKRVGSFSGDWFLDLSTVETYAAAYCPDNQIVSTNDSDLEYTSTNGIYLALFEKSILILSKSKSTDTTIKADGGFELLSNATSGDYSFVISIISEFSNKNFMFSTSSLTNSSSDYLELEDVNGIDSDDRFITFRNDLSDPFMPGVNFIDLKILKSYQFKYIRNIKTDVVCSSKLLDCITTMGLTLYYKDSNNFFVIGLTIPYLDGASKLNFGITGYYNGVNFYQVYESTDLVYSDNTSYTIEVDMIQDFSGVQYQCYAYLTSGSKPSNPQITYTNIVYEDMKNGNIGVFASGQDVPLYTELLLTDNLNVTFSNFSVKGDNIEKRGVLRNSVYDDLQWDTRDEYLLNLGSAATASSDINETVWTYNDEDLCLDADITKTVTSVDKYYTESVTLKNIQLEKGKYQVEVKIDSTDAIKRGSGMIFCSTDGETGLNYSIELMLDSSDNATLEFHKYGSSTSELGTYGFGGYGTYGYGGVGANVTLISEDVSYTIGSWKVLEVWYDDELRTFDFYYYNKGDGRPSTATMTYKDDTFYEYGNIGLINTIYEGTGDINSSFKNLRVDDTVEHECSEESFMTMGGIPHGARYDTVETVTMFDDKLQYLDYAKYNLFINTKVNFGSTSQADLYFENTTDTSTLSLTQTPLYEAITASNDMNVQNEIINVTSADADDEGYIGIKLHDETIYNQPIMVIDYMSLIPISQNSDSDYIYPFDVGYQVYNDMKYRRELMFRKYNANKITRLVTNFAEL